MVGLDGMPGTDVLPMCSTASMRDPSDSRSNVSSAAYRSGQVGSQSDRRTFAGRYVDEVHEIWESTKPFYMWPWTCLSSWRQAG